MIRLFISLYFIIIVGLLTINWGAEFLWKKIQPEIDGNLITSIQLANALPNLLSGNKEQLKQFRLDTNIDIDFVEKNDYAWQEKQYGQFNKGLPVVIYNEQDQAQIFVQSKVQHLLIELGPIEHQQTSLFLKYAFNVCSYIILAFFISIWLQPVWRDLNYLKTTAAQISAHNFDIFQQSRSRSPITSIVDSVHHMAEKIVGLLAEQKELINAVSHELRTPVARLRFAIAMIENLPKEQAKEIDQDIVEIEQLIDEMLSYSRLENMPASLERTSVNIDELLQHLVKKTKRTTKININVKNKADQALFFCQGDLVERACQNLISNAVRYAKREIEIVIEASGSSLIIKVSDDGEGVALKHIKDIFKPFHRIEPSRNKSEGGYGLGLAIVQKAAQWHQGDCKVEQSDIGGATFIFTINAAIPNNRIII